jgi:two-component system, NtrC family, nitrogen regulation sensor histidine kinase NtrY
VRSCFIKPEPEHAGLRQRLGGLKFEHRIFLLIVLPAVPAAALAIGLFWTSNYPALLKWTATFVLAGFVGGASWAALQQVVRPLQTISNLLAALRQEDFSTRARGARPGDALGEVFLEINTLSALLQEQRLGALEATALLRTVMAEIEVAVFTFDEGHRLKLVNRAGQKLLAQPAERLLDRTAGELNLADCLEGEPSRTMQTAFPSGVGRWSVRRTTFRQGGRPRYLVVIADLSRALREEERLAWQRLIRVMGHEINNSLAPIQSLAGTLRQLASRDPLPVDWKDDMTKGLEVISARTQSLGRFMEAYTRLARLPAPRLQALELGPWLARVARLETRLPVTVHAGPALTLHADPDQLEQALINLLRNAADAVLQPNGERDTPKPEPEVSLSWQKREDHVLVHVVDNGPGLSGTANLFVPFFTTKQGGTGIGLVLSRQIVEAHAGSLQLENRTESRGCTATLILPLVKAP